MILVVEHAGVIQNLVKEQKVGKMEKQRSIIELKRKFIEQMDNEGVELGRVCRVILQNIHILRHHFISRIRSQKLLKIKLFLHQHGDVTIIIVVVVILLILRLMLFLLLSLLMACNLLLFVGRGWRPRCWRRSFFALSFAMRHVELTAVFAHVLDEHHRIVDRLDTVAETALRRLMRLVLVNHVVNELRSAMFLEQLRKQLYAARTRLLILAIVHHIVHGAHNLLVHVQRLLHSVPVARQMFMFAVLEQSLGACHHKLNERRTQHALNCARRIPIRETCALCACLLHRRQSRAHSMVVHKQCDKREPFLAVLIRVQLKLRFAC
mmetsp:Transcript_24861/g.40253  ORF Transcript_24861/g.40253 Transcript_24861/m.40253 type:complete len:323 (+) Transcript_24861:2358-3326(+)